NMMPIISILVVGNADQLPSIGSGTVFKDIIKSSAIKTAILDTVYRQGEGSSIVKLAYDIANDENMNIETKFKDRVFFRANTNQIADLVDTVEIGRASCRERG